MKQLPTYWTPTILSEICDVVRGITFPASAKQAVQTTDNICCLRTSNIQREIDWTDVYFVPREYVKREEQFVQPGDILMSMANSYELVGKVAVARAIPYPAAFGAFLSAIRPAFAVEGQYLFHLLRSDEVQRDLRKGSSQTVNIANISVKSLGTIPVPLAPLNEQRRIADKLDQTLAIVERALERLRCVPGILKRFRQSVLAAATSGKLTEDWRTNAVRDIRSWRDHVGGKPVALPNHYHRLTKQAFKVTSIEHDAGELPSNWLVCTIGDLYKLNVLIDFADGNHGSLYPRKDDFGESGVLFLTATQIGTQWELDIHDCPRLRSDKAEQLIKGWAQSGDVLITHNATVGRVALLEGVDERVLLGTSVTFYRFNADYIDPRYARILFSSSFFQNQLESVMQQTTRDQVPITKQVSLNFICPPIEEQQEIVRRVEALFAQADRIEASHQAALARVEKLAQALLAKAFRGELVPQDPNDEPASLLLERIHAARAQAIDKPKTRTKRPILPKAEVIMLTLDQVAPDHLTTILRRKSDRRLEAKALWRESQLEIPDFYEQLKAEAGKGLLREVRGETRSFLEAA